MYTMDQECSVVVLGYVIGRIQRAWYLNKVLADIRLIGENPPMCGATNASDVSLATEHET